MIEKNDLTQNGSNKAKLLSMVSHEIRTPLHGIIGLTEQLQDTTLTQEQKDLVDNLLRTERILMNLVNDVLDYSKLKDAAFDIKLKPTKIQSVLDDIRFLFMAVANQKGLSLVVHCDVIDKIVKVDELRLKQVLSNLTNNGLKFTDTGGITLVCTQVSGEISGRVRYKFEVIDTGKGIPEEVVNKIFDEYYQTEIGSKKEGTGLGLTISNMILSKMDSTLELTNSDGGQGATFFFFLDLEVAEEVQPEHKERISHHFQNAHALVIDDDAMVQQISSNMLLKEDIKVDLASSISEGKEKFRKYHPELVFLDMELEDGTGDQMVQFLRNECFYHGVIICTTASTHSTKDIIAMGFDDILRKPFNRRSMNRVLARLSQKEY